MVDTNFAKRFENATQKEIIHALALTERKAEKLALQTKENKERFKFLQSKLKSSFSLRKRGEKAIQDEPTEETKAILAKNDPSPYTSFDSVLKAVDDELKVENAQSSLSK
ncbi:hypothetical protein [Campylobacter sp. CCS1377]|uniref:Uncharacterized protein n=1 Tax=Campylobacter sp. CCS1377 TaxID=3158229 RepID=A0AAU7E714_9BACT|nr:hypothetical protein [Campylobacter jejuni]